MSACWTCGAELRGAAPKFCRACGAAVEVDAAPGLAADPPPVSREADTFVPPPRSGQAPASPTTASGARTPGYLLVGVACVLVSVVGWIPLSFPSRIVNGQLGHLALWNVCTDLPAGSVEMFGCSMIVGLITVALGPLLTAYILYLFRAQLSRAIRAVLAHIEGLQGLTPAIVATAVFLVAWAGTHFETSGSVGLLPNLVFPAVIGLFAHGTTTNAATIQKRFVDFFERRDRLPTKVRLGMTILLTTGFAILLSNVFEDGSNRVVQPTTQQQVVVLFGLVVGYALMVPKSGDPLQDARRLAQRIGVGR